MIQWEFMYLSAGTNQMDKLKDYANRLGALGWEPVSITAADKTVGLNSMMMTFKRPVLHPPEPPTERAEWHADPTGRHERRRWSWRGWTADVADGKKRSVDVPTMYPDPELDRI